MYCGVCNIPHDRPTLYQLHCITLSVGAGGLVVWASALPLHAESRGFDSTFPAFFYGVVFAGGIYVVKV